MTQLERQYTTGVGWQTVEASTGSGGGPTVLGPFEVNWDDPDIDGDGVVVAEVDAGTILIDAWVRVVTPWDTGPATLALRVVGVSDPTNWQGVYEWDVNAPQQFDADGAVSLTGNVEAFGGGKAVFVTDGLLLVGANASGAAAGQAQVYALVVAP